MMSCIQADRSNSIRTHGKYGHPNVLSRKVVYTGRSIIPLNILAYPSSTSFPAHRIGGSSRARAASHRECSTAACATHKVTDRNEKARDSKHLVHTLAMSARLYIYMYMPMTRNACLAGGFITSVRERETAKTLMRVNLLYV